jgi:hypothetical protein
MKAAPPTARKFRTRLLNSITSAASLGRQKTPLHSCTKLQLWKARAGLLPSAGGSFDSLVSSKAAEEKQSAAGTAFCTPLPSAIGLR